MVKMASKMKRSSMMIATGVGLSVSVGALAQTGGTPEFNGPDVTLCQVYGLAQYGKLDGIIGLAFATTSWNIGDRDFAWFQSPSAQHPYIVMNMYRLDPNGRMVQIGQSWIKHGFYALGNTQCGGSCTYEPGHSVGNWLGQNCTDTYGSSLNADQSGLGPRFEVNPWAGTWQYNGSMMQQGGPSNTPIRRRLQVADEDLNPALHPGSQYLYEAYYVHFADIDVMNSAACQYFTPIRNASTGNYSFTQPGAFTFPKIGFAFTQWEVTQREIIAEQLPVVEFQSPDGRSVLSTNVIDLGDGRFRYEYAIANVDMDRQVGSFSVPVPSGVTIEDIGFHAVRHHDEPYNARLDQGGVPINNAAWAVSTDGGAVTWSTTTNPIRWGTMYNFWFTADSAPVDAVSTVGLFRTVADPSRPNTLPGPIQGPGPVATPCTGDLTGDGVVDADDLGVLLSAFGTADGDLNGDGTTNADDLGILLSAFGQGC
jgi:hypothetical protein